LIWQFANPFAERGRWFKGNLHTHSTISDGVYSPSELVTMYSEAGYDFLSITDHGKMCETEGLDDHNLTLLPGEEICVGKSNINTLYHIVGIDIKKDIPFEDFSLDVNPQKVLDYLKSEKALSIIAHPYWSGLDHQDLMKLKNYDSIEIYNTSCDYERNTGFSAPHIDGLLTVGRKPLIIAVDDHHGARRPMIPLDACHAWINVKARTGTVKELMSHIKRGLFYSSTGPEIKEISLDENGIFLRCSPAKSISFVSSPSLGMKFYAQEKPLTQALYKGTPGETYVRIEVMDYEGNTAWTNPFYVD
jgi:hypothetical protein